MCVLHLLVVCIEKRPEGCIPHILTVQTGLFSVLPLLLSDLAFLGLSSQILLLHLLCSSKILFLLSSLPFTLSFLNYHCHFSKDFRKEQERINILLNNLFFPSILLFFFLTGENRHSESLSIRKHEFLLKPEHIGKDPRCAKQYSNLEHKC